MLHRLTLGILVAALILASSVNTWLLSTNHELLQKNRELQQAADHLIEADKELKQSDTELKKAAADLLAAEQQCVLRLETKPMIERNPESQ